MEKIIVGIASTLSYDLIAYCATMADALEHADFLNRFFFIGEGEYVFVRMDNMTFNHSEWGNDFFIEAARQMAERG